MVDVHVRHTQRWLNAEYGSRAGWVRLDEDGITGWGTIYGLRRALQAELGISPLASGFGPATSAAFRRRIGRIGSPYTGQNVLRILSGALWCKGYTPAPVGTGMSVAFGDIQGSVASVRQGLGLAATPSAVDVKIMASLLSMDAYTVLPAYGGTEPVQSVQRWLNGTYQGRKDFQLVPCDGVHSRSVQTALLMALQYELGMAGGVANGNFVNGTITSLKAPSTLRVGSKDGSRRIIKLFHAALILNGLTASFDSTFTTATRRVVRDFQKFMEIPQSGDGDYTTWCNLLVSCGDTTISTRGFDTNRQLLNGMAASAARLGYTHAGRYLVGREKYITADEIANLRDAGLALVPIFQRFNDSSDDMTYDNGRLHGIEAVSRANVLGLPSGTIIYFTVDYDPTGDAITGPVFRYFRAVKDIMSATSASGFKVGVYGTRNVCQKLLDEQLVTAAYVAGMSTEYAGNMGFPMPQEWRYNQIVETTADFRQTYPTPIDKVVVSRNAEAVDLGMVPGPPLEQDGTTSETGFSVLFQWYVEAETRCAVALGEHPDDAVKQYAPNPGIFILGWLRKPTYWEGSLQMWKAYTPELGDSANVTARSMCEYLLESTVPALQQPNYDYSHWAASTLGYATWGLPQASSDYGYGNLGGWLLDLYSLFGEWQRSHSPEDLYSWMAARLGREVPSNFTWKDLIADVDAWLISKHLANNPGISLREALRTLLLTPESSRITAFYEGRFQSNPDNIGSCLMRLIDGIDVTGLGNLPVSSPALKQAAGYDYPATPEQATVCGRVLAERLQAG